MSERAAVILVICLVIGVLLWMMRGAGPSMHPESELLRLCRGNQEQAARLIQGELTRTPGISRAEAASRAVQRYRRDNR